MKQIMIAVLLLSSITAISQAPGFGIKGGLNYGSTGDLNFDGFQSNFEGENKVGYHVGLFGKFEFAGLFLQPEIVYTSLSTEYSENFGADSFAVSTDYDFSKIDVPVLLGINVLGPLNVKAGPSFQYILNNEFDEDISNVSDPENSFTVGYQLGAGVTLGQVGIDLRYEGAFNDNQAQNIQAQTNDVGFRVDNRTSQWIVSLSYSPKKNN